MLDFFFERGICPFSPDMHCLGVRSWELALGKTKEYIFGFSYANKSIDTKIFIIVDMIHCD